MRRSSSVSLFIISFLALSVHGESLLGLRYPLGMPFDMNSGMSQAMGGAGTAVLNDNHLMLHNPANLGQVQKTVLSSLLLFDFVNIKNTRTDNYTNHVQFVPQHLSFGFSLGKAGAIAASFQKRSDANIHIELPVEQYDNALTTIISSEQTLSRSGGVSTWQVGWGYPIGKWVRLGLAYERTYSSLTHTRHLTITGDFPKLSVDTARMSFAGNGLRAGIIVPLWHLSFGLSGEYLFPATAHYSDWSYVNTPTSAPSSDNFSLQLPPSLATGIAWQIDSRWLTAVDLNFTLWDQYSSEGVLNSGALRDAAVSFSVGAEFIPAPDELTPAYWETIPMRAGFRYAQLPTDKASEYAFSLGIGLPFPVGGGLVDLNLEYGRRHDESYTDYTEELFRIGLGINGGRKWRKAPQGTY